MRYFPQRARKNLDIALLLSVCPQCLGDLVPDSDFAGDYYRCLQCNERMEPRSDIGHLAELAPLPEVRPATSPSEFFPPADRPTPEPLMS